MPMCVKDEDRPKHLSSCFSWTWTRDVGMCEAKILEVSNNQACFIVWSKVDIYANVAAWEYHYRELRPLYSDLLAERPVKATTTLFVRNPSWTCWSQTNSMNFWFQNGWVFPTVAAQEPRNWQIHRKIPVKTGNEPMIHPKKTEWQFS